MIPIHRRKPQHSQVRKKNSYKQYKDDLGADFNKSCGYCDCPDFVCGGKAGFQIDHFAPKSKFPHLELTYTNLIYSCPVCNRGKSNKWPSDKEDISFLNDEGFVHPCSKIYDEHIKRSPAGEIVGKTPLGNYMIRTMKLSLTRHQIIWIREELFALISEVKKHINTSSDLKQKYSELTMAYFEYDELLRSAIDKR